MPAVKKALASADGGRLLAELKDAGKVTLALPDGQVELDADDLHVRLEAKEGWAAAQGPNCVVVLATELTDALVQEGWAREIVRALQDFRKEIGCRYTDRIAVGLETDAAELQAAIGLFTEYIKEETLAVRLVFGPLDGVDAVERKVAEHTVRMAVRVEERMKEEG